MERLLVETGAHWTCLVMQWRHSSERFYSDDQCWHLLFQKRWWRYNRNLSRYILGSAIDTCCNHSHHWQTSLVQWTTTLTARATAYHLCDLVSDALPNKSPGVAASHHTNTFLRESYLRSGFFGWLDQRRLTTTPNHFLPHLTCCT